MAGEDEGEYGHRAGALDEELGPAEEEAPEPAVGLSQEDVVPSRLGETGGELGVAEGAAERQKSAHRPRQ